MDWIGETFLSLLLLPHRLHRRGRKKSQSLEGSLGLGSTLSK